MKRELEKQYNPKNVEDRMYAKWVEEKYFHAQIDENKTPYTIVIPPPNITGSLHMGHAMDETLQDILIRTKRMQGYAALWLPGTDHASIATEAKIVAAMKEEGLTKADLGRDGFMERAWQWKETYGGRIVEQLKKIGSSCDWDRLAFTMDEHNSEAVKEVFIRLYEKGLIYRGERIVNWCPYCKTSISDAEVDYEEQAGHLWHIRYPIKGTIEFITVATSRPETMLADVAVAVNPNDERYKHLLGKNAILPLVGREIPIIADEYVEEGFGTGAVKITPAHDPNDFEVGARHNLPVLFALTEEGTITEDYPAYAGLDRYVARKAIVKDLEAGGYLVKTEEHMHNVGACYRCGTTIEPMVSEQWFVKMQPLAEPAIKVVKDGEIKFVPERFDKIYFNWMENIKDWCISRQLWWGHRIPAYYCDACGEVVVSKEEQHTCPKCGGALRQDEDTLDTWFSSGLWPFATLGWPDENAEDFKYFYPTNTLVTGYDIIFFWVARMIFLGLEFTGEIPFDTVYIHGLVRDEQGRKMSKSLGNGVDPLELIEDYGADALRFTLVTGSTPGNDSRFGTEKVLAARNFTNKLWNAARFVLMNIDENMETGLPEELEMEDKWVLSALNSTITSVNESMDKLDLGLAGIKIEDFIWNVYCDWYIEIAKLRLNGEDAKKAENARKVLVYVLTKALQLLHPFMPFITEEIYLALPGAGESIMISEYPQYEDSFNFPEEEASMQNMIDLIKEIRTARAEIGAHPAKKTDMFIETGLQSQFEKGKFFIQKFGFASEVEIGEAFTGDATQTIQVVTGVARAFLPMAELIDKEKETARLNKELVDVEKDISMLVGKLGNEGFIAKAPEEIVAQEKEKLSTAQEKKEKILESLKALG